MTLSNTSVHFAIEHAIEAHLSNKGPIVLNISGEIPTVFQMVRWR